MREITEKLPVASLSKVAILASLNIADELFKERASREREGESLTDRTTRLHAVIDRLDQLLPTIPRVPPHAREPVAYTNFIPCPARDAT